MSSMTRGIATAKFLILVWGFDSEMGQSPYGRIVPSLNLYPSFSIVFNVSFVGLCLIFIFELYACGIATGYMFYFLIC